MHTRPRKEILWLTLSYSGQRSLSIYFYTYKDFVKERDSGALVLAKIINKKSGTLRYYAFVCVCAGALPGGAIAPSDSQKFLQYKPLLVLLHLLTWKRKKERSSTLRRQPSRESIEKTIQVPCFKDGTSEFSLVCGFCFVCFLFNYPTFLF